MFMKVLTCQPKAKKSSNLAKTFDFLTFVEKMHPQKAEESSKPGLNLWFLHFFRKTHQQKSKKAQNLAKTYGFFSFLKGQ